MLQSIVIPPVSPYIWLVIERQPLPPPPTPPPPPPPPPIIEERVSEGLNFLGKRGDSSWWRGIPCLRAITPGLAERSKKKRDK